MNMTKDETALFVQTGIRPTPTAEERLTADDVLAYLATKPKRERPTELRSDARMLAVWLRLRDDQYFRDDVVCRHGLHNFCEILESDETHEHAVSNAWGHCVQVWVQEMAK